MKKLAKDIKVNSMKPFYWSKTFWMNIIMMTVAILELIADFKYVSVAHIAFVTGVLNIVLRFWFTSVALRFGK